MKVCRVYKMSPKLPEKIIKKNSSAIHQTGLNIKMSKVIGTESARAVNAASCCGEKFFVEGISLTPEGKFYFSEDI